MPAVRRAFRTHPDLRFALRAGLSQDHYRVQRLGKQPRDEINVLRPILLPKLPDLKFRDAHKLTSTLECPAKGVNSICRTRYKIGMAHLLSTPSTRHSSETTLPNRE
jgi:hypothetical protein